MRDLAKILRPEPPPNDPIPDADMERIRRIRVAAGRASKAFRQRHPLVDRSQSAIGLALLLGSASAMTACAGAYALGALPAWATVLLVAFACSIAHEIEHDLIHRMYFPRSPLVRNAMLALGWMMRPSTVNPWIRTVLHLDHHRVSGTESDIEERAITNGEPWSVRRLLMTADNFLAIFLRLRWRHPRRALAVWLHTTLAHFPFGWAYHAALVAFFGLHLWAALAGAVVAFPLATSASAAFPVVDFLGVVFVLPSLLRTFCLHFVSSNVHYYGDVPIGNVLRQTQVIDRWFFLPFQAFCFNFGSTHAIHHFWVPEPFYVRQATAREVHAVMRENGVRWNDLGTFRRANRYGIAPARDEARLAEVATAA